MFFVRFYVGMNSRRVRIVAAVFSLQLGRGGQKQPPPSLLFTAERLMAAGAVFSQKTENIRRGHQCQLLNGHGLT